MPVPLNTAAVVFENDEDDDALFFFARAESRLLLLFLLLLKEETSNADFNECVEKDIYACVCVCACVFSNALWMIGTCVWRAFHSGEEKPPKFGFIHERTREGLFLYFWWLFFLSSLLKKMNALNNYRYYYGYYSFQAPLYFSSLALWILLLINYFFSIAAVTFIIIQWCC